MEEQSVQLGPWARLLTATSDPKGVLAVLSDKDNVRRLVSKDEIQAIFNAWFSPRFFPATGLAGDHERDEVGAGLLRALVELGANPWIDGVERVQRWVGNGYSRLVEAQLATHSRPNELSEEFSQWYMLALSKSDINMFRTLCRAHPPSQAQATRLVLGCDDDRMLREVLGGVEDPSFVDNATVLSSWLVGYRNKKMTEQNMVSLASRLAQWRLRKGLLPSAQDGFGLLPYLLAHGDLKTCVALSSSIAAGFEVAPLRDRFESPMGVFCSKVIVDDKVDRPICIDRMFRKSFEARDGIPDEDWILAACALNKMMGNSMKTINLKSGNESAGLVKKRLDELHALPVLDEKRDCSRLEEAFSRMVFAVRPFAPDNPRRKPYAKALAAICHAHVANVEMPVPVHDFAGLERLMGTIAVMAPGVIHSAFDAAWVQGMPEGFWERYRKQCPEWIRQADPPRIAACMASLMMGGDPCPALGLPMNHKQWDDGMRAWAQSVRLDASTPTAPRASPMRRI